MKDVFICHASEDKLLIVEPLVSGLEKADITFWYDRAEIKWGDSITAKVNEGLRISRFVIVVLSEAFLNKNFPKRELFAVLNQEIYSDQTKVLPLFSDNKQKQKVLESLPLLNDKLYQTWNGNADTIIEALLPHLSEKTTLKFKDQKSVDDFLNRDKLISDKGVSYSKLRQLLEAQSWLEADQETIRLLYKATDKPEFTSTSHFSVVKIPNEALSSTELKRISDNDLIILDNLWKKYSHNKFGLSTQARIYEQEGEDYYAFANRVGWRKNGRWLGYNDLTWHLDAPIGHLPWLQGKKAYPTEKQMRDFHFSAWTLNLGDKHFAEDTFISVLHQKVISDRITKYLVKVNPKLISQGCSSIYNDIIYDGKVFKQVAKAASFKTSIGGLPMRGEAFFIFSYFSSVNDNSLREFATNCFNYAKKNSNFSGISQTVFNLKIPTNICFSISMTTFIDEKTKQQITETNPFEETVDILWYIVPIVYTLNEKQVYFYEEVLESKPWEFLRGEMVWKELRKIIEQTLSD